MQRNSNVNIQIQRFKSYYLLGLFFLCGFIYLIRTISAQQSPPPAAHNDPERFQDVKLTEVTFSNGIQVKNDDNTPMQTPHWEDKVNNKVTTVTFPDGNPDIQRVPDLSKGEKAHPNDIKSFAYSYKYDTKPHVAAKFKWKKEFKPEYAPYYAEAKIQCDNSKFILMRKELIANFTEYEMQEADSRILQKECVQAFLTANRTIMRGKNKLLHTSKDIKPLAILWTVTDKNNKVVDTSVSNHTIYVVLSEPKTTLRQETVFNIACHGAHKLTANNPTEISKCFDNIFEEYEDQQVLNMSSDILYYYKAYDNNVVTADDLLLVKNDGECGAWEELYRASIRITGIHNGYMLYIRPQSATILGKTHIGCDPLAPMGQGASPLLPQFLQYGFAQHQCVTTDYGAIAQIPVTTTIYDPSVGKKYLGNTGYESSVDHFKLPDKTRKFDNPKIIECIYTYPNSSASPSPSP